MLGAIIGDVIGSVYERRATKITDFPLFTSESQFTDDTVLTVAIADALLHRSTPRFPCLAAHQARRRYAQFLRSYGHRFPHAGYGEMFSVWLQQTTTRGYRSFANGAAMRVCPVGFAGTTLQEVLREATWSAVVTHNHRAGVRGARAIASAVYLARMGETKTAIRQFISTHFRYDLAFHLDDIRPTYTFDSSATGSVPQALVAFFESTDFEDAIRKAISLGGDSDTLACMTGGIAHAYYKTLPPELVSRVRLILDSGLKRVIDTFNQRYLENWV